MFSTTFVENATGRFVTWVIFDVNDLRAVTQQDAASPEALLRLIARLHFECATSAEPLAVTGRGALPSPLDEAGLFSRLPITTVSLDLLHNGQASVFERLELRGDRETVIVLVTADRFDWIPFDFAA